LLSSYFDVDDFEVPVKHFMDDLKYPLIDNLNLEAIINYRVVDLELNDNISGLFTYYTKRDRLF